jgi:biofilm protein TabA
MTRLSRRTFVGLLAAIGGPHLVHAFSEQSNMKVDTMDIISDDLQNWKKHPTLRAMADAFTFLARPDLEKLETGRHDIHGDDMYAMIQRSESRAIESAEFEAHRRYLDIQYLISGEEYIAVAPQRGLTVSKPYDESKDIEFYQRPEKYQKIVMHPGRFAVFYPQDAHLPNCYPNRPGPLQKVVVKVRLASLKK